MTEIVSSTLGEYLTIATEAAKKASNVLLHHFGKLEQIEEKSAAGDLVTEADKNAEEVILAYLKKKCPTHTILSEETGWHTAKNEDYLWAVDPLDGTTNYAHQVPIAAVSIALLHHGEPIVGVVYNPFRDELFAASKGQGAFLNGSPITVSKSKELGKSLLATGFAYDRRDTKDNNYAEFCYLTSLTQGVRRMGSAALDLSYLACGRFDGFWERGLNIWDIAAGALLVTEAGGKVSSYENGAIDLSSGRILASNSLIHTQMSEALQRVHASLPPILFSSGDL